MMKLRVKSRKVIKIAVIECRNWALILGLCNSKAHGLFIFHFVVVGKLSFFSKLRKFPSNLKSWFLHFWLKIKFT